MADDSAELRFGKYVRAGRLGSGGMGEVWKAWDSELNRWVALKFLKNDDPEELARFHREAQLAARLNHPNIAAIYEFSATEKPFLAMQFVAGQTLKTVPRADRRALVAMIRDAARAVHYAHSLGIIHRDLKPDNIMRTDSGHIYVMDFGLARAVSGDVRLTVSGLLVGTPAYMPPEQARAETVDARADVYALGATLYELLTDRMPFNGDTVFDVLRRVLDEDAKPPRKIDAAIDADLETIVLKCMEKERGRRYATAIALADDLDRWLAGEAIAARAPSMLYRARMGILRRKTLSAAIAVVLAMAAGFAIYASVTASKHAGERGAQRVYEEAKRELLALRLHSYRPDWSITDDELAGFQRLAARCRAQMERTGPCGDGWWVAARVAHVLGDEARARGDYERGLAAEPGHAWCSLFLGRLLIETALRGRYRVAANRAEQQSATQLSSDGFALVQSAVTSGGIPEIERDLAEAYARTVRGDGAIDFAQRMLLKWNGKDFGEEFHLIAGLAARDDLADRAGKALAVRVSFAEAHFWRGVALDSRGDHRAALADFDAALRINPHLLEAYISRSMARLEAGDNPGAIRDCEELMRRDPKSILGLVNRAVVRWRSGDGPGALTDYDKAIALDPRKGEALNNRGAVRVATGDEAGGLRDYEAALAVIPGFPSALYNRGIVRETRGDIDGALADYSAAISGDDCFVDARLARGAILLKRGEFDLAMQDYNASATAEPRRARIYTRRGMALEGRKRYTEAIHEYDIALKLDSRDDEAAFGRGCARQELGDDEGAFLDFTQALTLRPTHAEAFVNRATIHLKRGEPDAALADCAAALRVSPALAEARITAANVHSSMGNYAEARRELDAAIARDPRCIGALVNRCSLRHDQGDLAGALADGDAAVAVEPRHLEARINRGRARHVAGDAAGALEDFTEAIRLDPSLPIAWMNRGNVFAGRGDLRGAIVEYDKAIEIDSRYAEAYYNRALARYGLTEFDAALRDCDSAVQAGPGFAPTYIIRGLLRTRQGDVEGAMKDYGAAIAINPNLPEPYVNRAVLRRAARDFAGAQADLERVLSITPSTWRERAKVEELLKDVAGK